jgi:hypothetical protein
MNTMLEPIRREPQARVLYTSTKEGRETCGFMDAPDLATAERKLVELGHSGVRLWSHPFFGDAPGETPEDAMRRAPKPPVAATWWTLAGFAATLPGTLFIYVRFVVEQVVMPVPRGPRVVELLLVASLCACAWLAVAGFKRLRRELAFRRYGHARALLWTLRLAAPYIAPLFAFWTVRIRAGTLGLERALRPYAWLRVVGLRGFHDQLHLAALDQLVRPREEIALLRQALARGPSASREIDLALRLVLYEKDAQGARAVLTRSSGGLRIVKLARRVVLALVAIEAHDVHGAADIHPAAFAFDEAARGAWRPLLDAACARADALAGRVDRAIRHLGAARDPLLWAGQHDVLDDAARDVVRAIDRRRPGGPAGNT